MPALPALSLLSVGFYEATCGKCLTFGASVGTEPREAWDGLLRAGWVVYLPASMGGRPYALCPKCAKDPPDIDRDAAAARRGRRRRK